MQTLAQTSREASHYTNAPHKQDILFLQRWRLSNKDLRHDIPSKTWKINNPDLDCCNISFSVFWACLSMWNTILYKLGPQSSCVALTQTWVEDKLSLNSILLHVFPFKVFVNMSEPIKVSGKLASDTLRWITSYSRPKPNWSIFHKIIILLLKVL